MKEHQKSLFRKHALEASERMNHSSNMIEVLPQRLWITLAAIFILLLSSVGWLFWGKLSFEFILKGQIYTSSQNLISILCPPPGEHLANLLVARGDITSEPQVVSFLSGEKAALLKTAMEVVVYPDTVNKHLYGGIKATVLKVMHVNDFKKIANTQIHFNDLHHSSKNRFAVIFSLKKKKAGQSGFEWTKSEGPDYPIGIDTGVEIRVTSYIKNPIDLIIDRNKRSNDD